MVVPADGPASDTGASVGALVGGTEVAVGSDVGGKAVGIGVEVEAGAQAANRIVINKIQINRFIQVSCSSRELYLLRHDLKIVAGFHTNTLMLWALKSGWETGTKRGTERIKSLIADDGIQLASIDSLNRASLRWIHDHALLLDTIRNRIRQTDIMIGRIFGK